MSLSDDYFRDTDEAMLAYLEEQAKGAITGLTTSNTNNRQRAEKIMSYLLLGIGSLILLIINNPNILQFFAIKLGACILLIGWEISVYILASKLFLSSAHSFVGNAPEKLYNISFKYANDPMKLTALRQMELRNYSDTIKELTDINKRFQIWTDIAMVTTISTPALAIIVSSIFL